MELGQALDQTSPAETPQTSYTLADLLGEDEEEAEPQQKPFGNESISEDEAVEMDKK